MEKINQWLDSKNPAKMPLLEREQFLSDYMELIPRTILPEYNNILRTLKRAFPYYDMIELFGDLMHKSNHFDWLLEVREGAEPLKHHGYLLMASSCIGEQELLIPDSLKTIIGCDEIEDVHFENGYAYRNLDDIYVDFWASIASIKETIHEIIIHQY